MAFRTILLPVWAQSEDGPALSPALVLAKRLSAHLQAVFIRPDPEAAYTYTGYWPSDVQIGRQELRDRVDAQGRAAAERARRRFAALCRKSGIRKKRRPDSDGPVSAEWDVVVGEPYFTVPEIARFSDLTVFAGAVASAGFAAHSVMEATLVRSGRPVLVVPEAGAGRLSLVRPLIAWDGSSACARAVAAWLASGLPCDVAEIVRVVHPWDEPEHPDALAKHLSWHGIEARAATRPSGSASVGHALLSAAADSGSDLIVMGGYGHSRSRETLFGGVTRHVLQHASVPLLLMH